ncbi:MAG: CoB--CoM heterodisulfide reductase iron-sulfur subunit A family protein [Methanobacteriota archaeon]
MKGNVVIIGGGVAGMQASLDLADMGFTAYLVEREPTIGGKMALLDKTFPTNDCAMCILAPKMNECYRHPNIKILAYSEVREVKGNAGDFKVKVLRKARYIDETKCTGCAQCIEKCPTKVPNKYNGYLDNRKAIYIPFPQAVPRSATIDKEHCLYLTREKCGVCSKICQAKAVDYKQVDKEVELDAGAIIIATGFDPYDPSELEEYGYGRYKNVVTALQCERLINSCGPSRGHFERPSDQKVPKTIAFIQCVGSRDLKHNPYCCGVCCMHATKESMLIHEHHPEIEPYIFYTDLRAFGKGFQEYIDRGKKEYGIHYIRSKPGEVRENPDTKNLTIWYYDKGVKSLNVEMVVLCTTLMPSEGVKKVAEVVGIEVNEYGFFKVKDALLAPLDARKEGIFLAGYCEAPKDIPDSVAQGSGAAMRAAQCARGS